MKDYKKNNELKLIFDYLAHKDEILSNYFDYIELPKTKKMSLGFSLLVKTIISQQLSGKAAEMIFERFLISHKLQKNFQAENILSATKESIRNCGISYSKAMFIISLRDRLIKKINYFSSLNKLNDNLLELELTNIKGVGSWTSRILMISLFGRYDVFPKNDGTLQKSIKIMGYKNFDINKISDNWKPYRSVAAKIIWNAYDKNLIK